MKVSVSWIFEHIEADWQKIDIDALVSQFNQKTAEIEQVIPVSFDLKSLALARVKSISMNNGVKPLGRDTDSEKTILVTIPEWHVEATLLSRAGAQEGDLLLVKKENDEYRWAYVFDFGGEKESILPALSCDESLVSGGWKKRLDMHDYILDIDNKSITNRPDLWSHRGLAREFAALLDLPLKPLDSFVAHNKLIAVKGPQSRALPQLPFVIENCASESCFRFAATYLSCVSKPTTISMAARLSRVDCRPIDAIVDSTNYVMFEFGQPLHAFDAQKFSEKKLSPRMAKEKESLALLDGQTIQLDRDDLVISDGVSPVALAGIMGGASTGVGRTTQEIVVESACFDAGAVRRAATRHRIRTEASARFEKSLDPNQNVHALARFLKLLETMGVAQSPEAVIVSLGAPAKEKTIVVAHEFIEKRLGVCLEPAFVKKTLEKLGCIVVTAAGEKKAKEVVESKKEGLLYQVSIPTYRGTKDVTVPEDLVEEVGRFYGYTQILPVLPRLALAPSDHEWVYQIRKIKQHMAYALSMRELCTYGMFDEEFLRLINWEPTGTVDIRNPISENLRRMCSSLVPNLFKAVYHNSADYSQLRFFEWGRVWRAGSELSERAALAGVVYAQKEEVDFYQWKAELDRFFSVLGMPVTWQKGCPQNRPWYAPYQTAEIVHGTQVVGHLGVVNPAFMNLLGEGNALVFELDGQLLSSYQKPQVSFEPIPKYPDVSRDISMFIPLSLTAQKIESVIAGADEKIVSVALVDFFEKDDWVDQRSLTFRFIIRDLHKTLVKQEADAVWERVAAGLKKIGAVIR